MKFKHLKAHMSAARAYATCSTADKLKVGALYVKNNRPIGEGYNGMPPGDSNVCEDYDPETREMKTKPEVRHAEFNALLSMAGSNESVRGADLFVTHSPCPQCANDQATAGVRRVFFEEHYRLEEGIKTLLRRGVEVFQLKEDHVVQYSLNGLFPRTWLEQQRVYHVEDWS